MKFSLITSLLAVAVAATPKELFGRTGCGSDNCGRAVEAGRLGEVVMAQHVDDCKAYVVTTTPAAKTVYATKIIPNYATACSGEPRYLTACACLGATPLTVEAPTPTVTSTVTVFSNVASTVTLL